jgi:hypothetical protein
MKVALSSQRAEGKRQENFSRLTFLAFNLLSTSKILIKNKKVSSLLIP